MMAPYGSAVYAISDGDVVELWTTDAKDSSFLGPGNSVIFVQHTLSDGSKFLACYMHVRPTVHKWDHVKAGQPIATVGPWYNETHLHFGIHPNLTAPTAHWGIMDNKDWASPNGYNGYVDPVNWIKTKTPQGASPPPPPAVQQGTSDPEPLYRYSGPFHFYTTSFSELGYGGYGYGLEKIQCRVFSLQGSGMTPLYRYASLGKLGHFYTTNWGELGWGNSDWRFENIQCYVYASPLCTFWGDTTELYRYVNVLNGDRFYTTGYGELKGGNATWRYEGIQCWVLP